MQKDTKTIKIGQMNSLLGPKHLFYMHNGGHPRQWSPSLILNWLLGETMSAAIKHSKGHKDNSNRPIEFNAGTKTDFHMKNGGHLE